MRFAVARGAERQAHRRDAARDEVAPHRLCALARDLEVSLGVTAAVGLALEPQREDVGVFGEDFGQRVEEGDLARLDVGARREVSPSPNLERGAPAEQVTPLLRTAILVLDPVEVFSVEDPAPRHGRGPGSHPCPRSPPGTY